MMKHTWVNVFFLAMVAATAPACAEEVLACETQSVDFKKREFRCPLTAKANAQQIRFKANFTGSHDDTQLSMTLTLDGLPVTCSKGSKTWLNSEDGDVSLHCHLVLDGTAGAQRMLRATVNFYHAEFAGIQLNAL
jgi:hypothetical protein